MNPFLLVPILLCAASLVPLASTAIASSTAADSFSHRALAKPVIYKGKVAGWSVSADGTVAVLLDGTHDSKAFSLWFATPASRNATTRYESLVLEAILAASSHLQDMSVTVVTDGSKEVSGDSIEDAFTLRSIAHP